MGPGEGRGGAGGRGEGMRVERNTFVLLYSGCLYISDINFVKCMYLYARQYVQYNTTISFVITWKKTI